MLDGAHKSLGRGGRFELPVFVLCRDALGRSECDPPHPAPLPPLLLLALPTRDRVVHTKTNQQKNRKLTLLDRFYKRPPVPLSVPGADPSSRRALASGHPTNSTAFSSSLQ